MSRRWCSLMMLQGLLLTVLAGSARAPAPAMLDIPCRSTRSATGSRSSCTAT